MWGRAPCRNRIESTTESVAGIHNDLKGFVVHKRPLLCTRLWMDKRLGRILAELVDVARWTKVSAQSHSFCIDRSIEPRRTDIFPAPSTIVLGFIFEPNTSAHYIMSFHTVHSALAGHCCCLGPAYISSDGYTTFLHDKWSIIMLWWKSVEYLLSSVSMNYVTRHTFCSSLPFLFDKKVPPVIGAGHSSNALLTKRFQQIETDLMQRMVHSIYASLFQKVLFKK